MWVSRKRWKELENELMKHSGRLATLEGRADTRDVVELPMGDRTALGLVPMQVRVPFSTWARLVSRALRIVGSPGQGASAQQLPEPETKKKGAK